ncbi:MULTISPECIES: DUF3114 domain-containing protein [Enterococcus]|nr:DUF3114 domain-containing protein [Enterococcus mundtii]MDB7100982.1 DUF3114 domain-containing protein [Enterococcus mundtii]
MKLLFLMLLLLFCGCTVENQPSLKDLYPNQEAETTYHEMVDYFNLHVTYYKEHWQYGDQQTKEEYSYITENLNKNGHFQRSSVEQNQENKVYYRGFIDGDLITESILDESTNAFQFNERFLLHTGTFMGNLLKNQEGWTILKSQRQDHKEKIELSFDFKIDESLYLKMFFTIGESGFLKEIKTRYFDREDALATNQFIYYEDVQINSINEKKELPVEQIRQEIIFADESYHTLMKELTDTNELTLVAFDEFVTQKEYPIGSNIYTQLWMMAEGDAKEKLLLLLEQLGATIDEFNMLQLNEFRRFDEFIAPHSFFLHYIAELVQEAFPNGLLKAYEEGEHSFVRSVHQLRMYLDKLNLSYVRNHFKKNGMTDEEALAEYGKRWGVEQQYSPARFHNKYPKNKTFKESIIGRENRKILVNRGFHSEFILNPEGNFVSSWNVLKMENDRVDSNPAHYSFHFDLRKELLDGESFNYASKNDRLHKLLDSSPSKKLDHQVRQQAKKGWISASITEYFHRHPNISPMILGLLLFLAFHFFVLFCHRQRKRTINKKVR